MNEGFAIDIENGSFSIDGRIYNLGDSIENIRKKARNLIKREYGEMSDEISFVSLQESKLYGLTVYPKLTLENGILTEVIFDVNLSELGDGFYTMKDDSRALEKNAMLVQQYFKQIFKNNFAEKGKYDFAISSINNRYIIKSASSREFYNYLVRFGEIKNMDIKTLLENGQFPIGGIIVDKNTKEKDLLDAGAEFIAENAGYSIIKFKPNPVKFLGGNFYADFMFYDGKLLEVTLRPIVPNITIPNYPDENYEKAKYDFCVNELKQYFTLNKNEENTRSSCETNDYEVICYRILDGHQQFCGGDLHIEFNSKNGSK